VVLCALPKLVPVLDGADPAGYQDAPSLELSALAAVVVQGLSQTSPISSDSVDESHHAVLDRADRFRSACASPGSITAGLNAERCCRPISSLKLAFRCPGPRPADSHSCSTGARAHQRITIFEAPVRLVEAGCQAILPDHASFLAYCGSSACSGIVQRRQMAPFFLLFRHANAGVSVVLPNFQGLHLDDRPGQATEFKAYPGPHEPVSDVGFDIAHDVWHAKLHDRAFCELPFNLCQALSATGLYLRFLVIHLKQDLPLALFDPIAHRSRRQCIADVLHVCSCDGYEIKNRSHFKFFFLSPLLCLNRLRRC